MFYEARPIGNNGVFQVRTATLDTPDAVTRFVDEHPTLRITALSAYLRPIGTSDIMLVLVTEPKAEAVR